MPMIPKSATTTDKKIKYVGEEEWINANTGEVQTFEVTNIETRDYNFTKVFMQNFLCDLESLGNKKLKAAIHICRNIDRDGYLIGTLRQLAKDAGCSYQTMQQTVKILIDCDFLKRVNNGAYISNANHMFKGTHNHRMSVLKRYYAVDEEETQGEEEQQAE